MKENVTSFTTYWYYTREMAYQNVCKLVKIYVMCARSDMVGRISNKYRRS